MELTVERGRGYTSPPCRTSRWARRSARSRSPPSTRRFSRSRTRSRRLSCPAAHRLRQADIVELRQYFGNRRDLPAATGATACAELGRPLVRLARELNIDAEGIDMAAFLLADAALAADLALPIEELELTVRSYNCLKCEGIHSVGELLARSEADLMGNLKLRCQVDRRGQGAAGWLGTGASRTARPSSTPPPLPTPSARTTTADTGLSWRPSNTERLCCTGHSGTRALKPRVAASAAKPRVVTNLALASASRQDRPTTSVHAKATGSAWTRERSEGRSTGCRRGSAIAAQTPDLATAVTAVSAKAAEITATVALVQQTRGRGGLRGREPGGGDLPPRDGVEPGSSWLHSVVRACHWNCAKNLQISALVQVVTPLSPEEPSTGPGMWPPSNAAHWTGYPARQPE